MHRASTRYTKRPSSTKTRPGPGQYPEALHTGEGGDLRRKILQRTHSIASRSVSNSSVTTNSPGSTTKPRSPGLESYYMSAFLSPPRRSPSSAPSSPSPGHFPSPVPPSSPGFENHRRYSFYPSPKQTLSTPAPGSKDREDVDITDYYSESIRLRGLYATPFGDLPSPSPSPLSSSNTSKREETDSVTDLDFGLQMLLVRQMFGTNGVPGIQRGQDRNALDHTFGSSLGLPQVPPDGDLGEGLLITSDSVRRRGVSFTMGVEGRDAGAADNANIDVYSEFSTTKGWSPSADNGNFTDSSKLTLDSPHEADICDVELTPLSSRVGYENTFMNITPPHVFDAFSPILPPPCRIKTVSQLPTSVF
jgi:hypothetical protein